MAKRHLNAEWQALREKLSGYRVLVLRRDILNEKLEDLLSPDDIGAHTPERKQLLTELHRQYAAADSAALDITRMIDRLPIDSTERAVIELRHIGLKSWGNIQDKLYLSSRSCFRYYTSGLEQLLAMDDVRAQLGLPALPDTHKANTKEKKNKQMRIMN